MCLLSCKRSVSARTDQASRSPSADQRVTNFKANLVNPVHPSIWIVRIIKDEGMSQSLWKAEAAGLAVIVSCPGRMYASKATLTRRPSSIRVVMARSEKREEDLDECGNEGLVEHRIVHYLVCLLQFVLIAVVEWVVKTEKRAIDLRPVLRCAPLSRKAQLAPCLRYSHIYIYPAPLQREAQAEMDHGHGGMDMGDSSCISAFGPSHPNQPGLIGRAWRHPGRGAPPAGTPG